MLLLTQGPDKVSKVVAVVVVVVVVVVIDVSVHNTSQV
jgi:hypothetical protein